MIRVEGGQTLTTEVDEVLGLAREYFMGCRGSLLHPCPYPYSQAVLLLASEHTRESLIIPTQSVRKNIFLGFITHRHGLKID